MTIKTKRSAFLNIVQSKILLTLQFWQDIIQMYSGESEQHNDKQKTGQRVATIRLNHEAIITRADESHEEQTIIKFKKV